MEEIINDNREAARMMKGYKADRPRYTFWETYFHGRTVRSVVVSDIERVRVQLSQGKLKSNNKREPVGLRKIATLNRYLAVLKAAFNLAIKNGKAESNPVRDVSFPKENNERNRFLTLEEEARLLKVTPASITRLFSWPFIRAFERWSGFASRGRISTLTGES